MKEIASLYILSVLILLFVMTSREIGTKKALIRFGTGLLCALAIGLASMLPTL